MRYFSITVSVMSSNVVSWKKNLSFHGTKFPSLDHIAESVEAYYICDCVVVDNVQELSKEDYYEFFTGSNWEDISKE